MDSKTYENEILEWRAKRYDSLTKENGWLALAGLHWLKEGRNLIGSNPLCEVSLPESAPTFLGVIEKMLYPSGGIAYVDGQNDCCVYHGITVMCLGRYVQLTGDPRALAVHVEVFPTHIASLPVAVNLQCHSVRHREAML